MRGHCSAAGEHRCWEIGVSSSLAKILILRKQLLCNDYGEEKKALGDLDLFRG